MGEGNVGIGGKNRRCDVTVTQSKYPDQVRRMMASFGKPVSEYTRRDGTLNFSIYGVEFSRFFFDEFTDGHGNKRIPKWVRFAEKKKLKHLILGFLLGDGSFRKDKLTTDRFRVYGNAQLAEDLCEVSMKAGFVPNMHYRMTKAKVSVMSDGREVHSSSQPEYDVTLLSPNMKKGEPKSNKQNWFMRPYDGFVYCVKVLAGFDIRRPLLPFNLRPLTMTRHKKSSLWS